MLFNALYCVKCHIFNLPPIAIVTSHYEQAEDAYD